jgi:HEAT repeat protein
MLALGASICFGHGEGPPPPPPPNPPSAYAQDDGYERVYPPRWSWIHWWEANRDPYLRSIKQSGATQAPEPKVVADRRARAVKALVGGLAAGAPEVRAASALALGRMNERGALKALSAMASGDGSPKARQMALLALGLLDLPETREFLLAERYPTDPLMEAGCVGLGFLTAADDPKVVTVLQEALGAPKAGLAITSAWGLRRRADPACLKALKNVLVQSKSPWLASEAILALGERTDAEGLPVLANILLGTKQAGNVAAYQALLDHDNEITRAIGGARVPVQQLEQIRMLYQKYSQWRDFGPNGLGRTTPARLAIRVGAEKVYLTILRTSAAIALGHYRDPAATKALVDSLAVRDDGYAQTFKGFVLLSLAETSDPACLPPLMDYLGRTHLGGKAKSVPDLGSPLRGYAALALGLYSRPRAAPLQAGDPQDYDKVCQALGERLADTAEELEVRTACAMGLGLTARTENLRYLQKATETIRPADDLLGGYVLLARAMLGDRNIIPLAKKYLDAASEKKDTGGILARRATVLGLAMLDSQDVIPTLLDAWHLTYHVNREVAVALGLLAAYNVTEPLARLMETSPNPLEQAFAARCLGELFLAERPQRLRWLLNGSNYTLRNERMIPYQAVANEFLYEYLIPYFGDEWL